MNLPTAGTFDVPENPEDFLAENAAQAHGQFLEATRQLPGAHDVTTVSISANTIVPVFGAHKVDTENGVSSDELRSIQVTNMRQGAELVIWLANPAHTFTIKHMAGGTGTVFLAEGRDFVMDSQYYTLRFQLDGGVWRETGRLANNAAREQQQDDKLTMLAWFVRALAGGADGVFAFYPTGLNTLGVFATNPASMAVQIGIGAGMVGANLFYRNYGESLELTAPVTKARIDLIAVNAVTGETVYKIGDELDDPEPKALETNELGLALIHHVVGETVINDTDQSSGNGYIEDVREKINF